MPEYTETMESLFDRVYGDAVSSLFWRESVFFKTKEPLTINPNFIKYVEAERRILNEN